MRTKCLALAAIAALMAGCQGPTVPSLENLLAAPLQVSVAGRVLTLEPFLYRDFMPVVPCGRFGARGLRSGSRGGRPAVPVRPRCRQGLGDRRRRSLGRGFYRRGRSPRPDPPAPAAEGRLRRAQVGGGDRGRGRRPSGPFDRKQSAASRHGRAGRRGVLRAPAPPPSFSLSIGSPSPAVRRPSCGPNGPSAAQSYPPDVLSWMSRD